MPHRFSMSHLGRPRRAVTSFPTRRSAHAAAAAVDEPEPEPDQEHEDRIERVPRRDKGKQRANPQHEYSFPSSGRNGGPPDPYEVLGLDRNADERDVKQQYYRLAMLLHPDSSHPAACTENFSTLHRAYTLLSQPSSRNTYLQTGHGWGHTGSRIDAQMRAEAAMRRRGGSAAWNSGHPGYRGSDAGHGAWGGYREGGWEPYEDTDMGKGEARYMSNPRFFGVMAACATVMAWVQYQRLGMAVETRRELLDRQHVGASHALAEARQEAVLHGRERRERIRRRVREAEVLKEVERMEHGEN